MAVALDQDGTDRLVALFARDGYGRVEPPILQPADIFVDLSGEDIRRRLFATQDAAGRALCLRPDYTIPVGRLHLERGAARPAAYGYLGPVFRQRAGEAAEFLQAGIESIGRPDAAAADAEVLSLALEGLALLGCGGRVRLGDMGLLDAVLAALDLGPAARLRLVRSIVAGPAVAPEGTAREEAPAREQAGLLAAIEGGTPQAARALVEDVLAIAGIGSVAGRSAAEIAERFAARAANRSGTLPAEKRQVLDRYLAVGGDPDEAASRVRELADEAGLDIAAALDRFEERTGFMASAGLDIAALDFQARFARGLDYYTGFIFEVVDGQGARPLAAGGRYDRLLGALGSPEPVPAVGCAFWLDRIAAGRGA